MPIYIAQCVRLLAIIFDVFIMVRRVYRENIKIIIIYRYRSFNNMIFMRGYYYNSDIRLEKGLSIYNNVSNGNFQTTHKITK